MVNEFLKGVVTIRRNFILFVCAMILGTLITVPAARAAGRGEGGCVITPKAPIYRNSESNTIIAITDVGDCVAGATVKGGGFFGHEFMFTEENGRVQIAFIPGAGERGSWQFGYMKTGDLAKFTYECGCGQLKSEKEQCTPFSMAGFLPFDYVYNACFKEARDKKRAEILRQDAQVPASTTKDGFSAKRAEAALRNDDILSLAKVDLDDNLIISKIQAAEAINFDLSTEGILALKSAGISNAVIGAMMKRAGK